MKKKKLNFCLFVFFFFCSQYSDNDAESQNFLPEHNLGKKKYETEYVRAFPIQQHSNQIELLIFY